MKKRKDVKDFSNKDWTAMASMLSGENPVTPDEQGLSLSDDKYSTVKKWKQLENMDRSREIDVNKAWSNLHSRISEEIGIKNKPEPAKIYSNLSILRIAAIMILMIGLGLTALYLNDKGIFSKKMIAETGMDQKNLEILLPDGSKVILNHNTSLVYMTSFGKSDRQVKLSGEALFDIVPDTSKPFIIDAGKASVKVLGTTFNVITSNENDAIEVFVKNGKVLVTDSVGKQNITLDPGYLGTMSSGVSEKHVNNDPNYLAWNTNVLVYNGQKLEIVFKDLKRVYNLDIVADEKQILDIPLTTTLDMPTTTTIDSQSQEDIVKLICATFTLENRKEGNIYHLSRK
jgi:transmembrane sensor